MDLNDSLTLLIAGYAALVSTILAGRELVKGRRRLKIILEYIDFREYYILTIVNVGYRTISINGYRIEYYDGADECYEAAPAIALKEGERTFPVTIRDGENLSITIDGVVRDRVYNSPKRVRLQVYDAEGNVYRRYKSKNTNPKWRRIYDGNDSTFHG